MKRYYYISDDLNELETIEQELESAGMVPEQIHILSDDDPEVARHRLHSVSSFMKKDVVRSAVKGTVIGLVGAFLVLVLASLSNLPETYTWAPFIFLAIVVLGFCTWEGGLYGIQEPNREFERFNHELKRGNHLMFVDIGQQQTASVEAIVRAHPKLRPVGTGKPSPWFIIRGQELIRRWAHWGP